MAMTVTVEIIKIGDELGFILPDEVIDSMGLSVGDEIVIHIDRQQTKLAIMKA